MPASVERIPMQRAVAVIREGSIAIRPGWGQLIVPLVQAGITAAAVFLVVGFMNALPLWLLMVLLIVALLLGPAAVLGLIYSVYGTEFLIERHKGTARWHQGFLGLGIGTFELVPFERIERVVVETDFEADLTSGQAQDLVEIDVRIVKDNGRVLDVASVTAAHVFAAEALGRANRLGEAIGEMTGRACVPLVVDFASAAGAPAPSRRRRRRARQVPRTRSEAPSQEA